MQQDMDPYSVDPSSIKPSSNIEATEVESEVDDEVDELDSDTDAGDSEVDGAGASSKKNGLAGSGERIPGHSVLPALRLENIIQADGVTGNLALSKEGLFILSIATEEFIKRMVQAGELQASSERRTVINYRDIAATTQQYQEFMFLNDTIPAPLTLSEALLMRAAKEKELLEDDPAMSASVSLQPSHAAISHGLNIHKIKGKGRSANGQEKRNGSVTAGKRERRSGQHIYDDAVHNSPYVVDGDGTWGDWADGQIPSRSSSDHSRPPHNGRTSISAIRSPSFVNGQSSAPSVSGANTPALSRDEVIEHQSPPQHLQHPRTSPFVTQEETWPGQYTGPASGFLQGPGGPFGRVAQNPGRTIYSQQHRAD